MDRARKGGWVYIMADCYRGTMYVGVTADLAARVTQHREGTGSEHCARYGLERLVWAERCDTIENAIAHEKRLKRWRRPWKFELIERPIRIGTTCSISLRDQEAGPRIKSGVTRRYLLVTVIVSQRNCAVCRR